MFGKRKLNNTAAIAAPVRETVHNHEASKAANTAALVFSVLGAGIIAGLVLLWFVLWMISEAGYRDPAPVLAGALGDAVKIALLMAIVAFILWLVKWVLLSLLDAHHVGQIKAKELDLQIAQMQLRQIALPAEGSSRLLPKQYKFVRLLSEVMKQAYSIADEHGSVPVQPWARENAKIWFDETNHESPLRGQQVQELHRAVRPWLVKHKVITMTEPASINMTDYGDIGLFHTLLEQQFNIPIKGNSPANF